MAAPNLSSSVLNARGVVMHIDPPSTKALPEMMRLTFERHGKLAGVFGLPDWEFFVWDWLRFILLWFVVVRFGAKYISEMYEGNARLMIWLALSSVAYAPLCTSALSLDSHIFLRLLTSFEPLWLMCNWAAMLCCFAWDGIPLPLCDYGPVEWTYVVTRMTMSFSATFAFICGFQDALPDTREIRNSAAVTVSLIVVAVLGIYMLLGLFSGVKNPEDTTAGFINHHFGQERQ